MRINSSVTRGRSNRSTPGQRVFDWRRSTPAQPGRQPAAGVVQLFGITWRELPRGGISFAPACEITAAGFELGAALEIPTGKFRYRPAVPAPHGLEVIAIDGPWYRSAVARNKTAIAVLLEELRARHELRAAILRPAPRPAQKKRGVVRP